MVLTKNANPNVYLCCYTYYYEPFNYLASLISSALSL